MKDLLFINLKPNFQLESLFINTTTGGAEYFGTAAAIAVSVCAMFAKQCLDEILCMLEHSRCHAVIKSPLPKQCSLQLFRLYLRLVSVPSSALKGNYFFACFSLTL